MLTEEEISKINTEAKHYPHKKAACIEALKIVQKNKGWVSDENIRDIAQLLEMTTSEVDSVATFYSRIHRKPVGRHVILLCESISCWVMGYEKIYEYISGKLGIHYGETTKDGNFTVLPNPCLGNCDKAPSMIIDETLYDSLTIEKVDEILKNLN